MNLLRNIFGKKICSRNLNELPFDIGSCFSKLKTLISNNILDISLIKEVIVLIIDNINQSNHHEEYTQADLFIIFRKEIKRFYIQIKKEMKTEFNLTRYYQILNLTIFFYIVCFNIKNLYNIENSQQNSQNVHFALTEQKNFYEIFFEKNCMFIDTLMKVVRYIKATTESQTELFRLISNLFCENGEIFKIFSHPNVGQRDLFLKNKSLFKSVIPEMDEYNQISLNDVTNSVYKKILQEILELKINYESIFNSNKKNFCLSEDKPLIKSMMCQAILRIVFSREKYKFLDKNYPYELYFFLNLSKNCVSYYHENFGDNVNCLFRREELCDDLIKHIFFTFGNNFYNKCFYTSIKKLIDKYYIDSNPDELSYLTQDEFVMFYEDLLQKLKLFIPGGIRIILKLIYDNVLSIYEGKIAKDNFSPILTILFFNFFISPKMQDLYNISPIKNALIKNLNRLIRNICFNEKFKEGDEMKYFNDMIEICHLHTKSTIDKLINSFVVDDMDYVLKSEIEKNYKIVTFPPYLFYFDCDYVINLIECSMQDEMENDFSIEKNLVERIMSNKRNSFVIKFDFNDLKKLKILAEKDVGINTNENQNLNLKDDASEKSEDEDEIGHKLEKDIKETSVIQNDMPGLTKSLSKISPLNMSVSDYGNDRSNSGNKIMISTNSNRIQRSYTIPKRGHVLIPFEKPNIISNNDLTENDISIFHNYQQNLACKEREKPLVQQNTTFDLKKDYFDKK